MDGLVLFGLGNDDILARCQILSVWSSFIGTLPDLLISMFVVTVHNKQVLHFWVHLEWLFHLWESSLLLVWYILLHGLLKLQRGYLTRVRGDGSNAHQGQPEPGRYSLNSEESRLRSRSKNLALGIKHCQQWWWHCGRVMKGLFFSKTIKWSAAVTFIYFVSLVKNDVTLEETKPEKKFKQWMLFFFITWPSHTTSWM